mmetsp:Transcript_18959/g.24633  ORF Transcript_18959/g.24633 Transcript_18959/m.24633 type:complete len:80 (+) Transcript_18959:1048-1287(+)
MEREREMDFIIFDVSVGKRSWNDKSVCRMIYNTRVLAGWVIVFSEFLFVTSLKVLPKRDSVTKRDSDRRIESALATFYV